jgi:hypothetical protein
MGEWESERASGERGREERARERVAYVDFQGK